MKLHLTKSRGFSLTELLVVIAIIMILLGLVMTIANKVMASASGTRCMANLSQIGKALKAYSEDHDEKMPPFATSYGIGIPDGAPFPAEGQLKSALLPYTKSGEIFYCPDDPAKKSAVADRYGNSSLHTSYKWGIEAEQITKKTSKHFDLAFSYSSQPSLDRLFSDRYHVVGRNEDWLPHGDHECNVFFDLHGKCLSRTQAIQHLEMAARNRRENP